jgi:hypothetical protein
VPAAAIPESSHPSEVGVQPSASRGGGATRRDATRCDAMRRDAMRCDDAMRARWCRPDVLRRCIELLGALLRVLRVRDAEGWALVGGVA